MLFMPDFGITATTIQPLRLSPTAVVLLLDHKITLSSASPSATLWSFKNYLCNLYS